MKELNKLLGSWQVGTRDLYIMRCAARLGEQAGPERGGLAVCTKRCAARPGEQRVLNAHTDGDFNGT